MAATAEAMDQREREQQRLVFTSWEDLQTRLILVPRVEGEGTGAVVQSFFHREEVTPVADDHDEGTDTDSVPRPDVKPPCSIGTDMEGFELLGFGSAEDAVQSPDARDSTAPDDNDWREWDFAEILATIREAPTPFVLTFVKPSDNCNNDDEDESDNDSTQTIEFEEKKEDELPAIWSAQPTDESSSNSAEGDDNLPSVSAPQLDADTRSQTASAPLHDPVTDSDSLTNPMTQPARVPPPSQPTTSASSASTAPSLNGLFNDLGSSAFWSSAASRVKASSSALATGAALLAQEAKERAAVASSSVTTSRLTATSTTTTMPQGLRASSLLDRDDNDDEEEDDEESCPVDLYLHTSLGAWLSLQSLSKQPRTTAPSSSPSSSTFRSSPTSSSAERVVTNSSMVAVRVSEADPVRDSTVRYQWYRSDSARPDARRDGSESSEATLPTKNAQSPREETWSLLDGAVNASFQPTACEVGHRLRCVLTFAKGGSSEVELDKLVAVPHEFHPHQEEHISVTEHDIGTKRFVLDTPDVVRAALPLFNGSRQALARAAQFSGLQGRGKLEGRSLLVKVGIGMTKKSRRVTSAVTVYQVCGQTAEPMHDEETPILGVSARVPDHSNSKGLELVFARGIPDSAPMVSALATDNRFELQAPNRISRESLLLALGVANYNGRPVELNDTTILYESPTVEPPSPEDDTSSTSSFASCASSEDNRPSSNGNVDDELYVSAAGSPDSSSSRSTNDHPMPRMVSPPLHRPPLSNSQTTHHKRSLSLDCTTSSPNNDSLADVESSMSTTIHYLENELRLVKDKLDRKSKVVSELQRSVTQTQSLLTSSQQRVSELDAVVESNESELQSLAQALRLAEKRISHHDDVVRRMRGDHDAKLTAANEAIASQAQRIAELEKAARILQNEKAVQSAALEAREGKLTKMAALQRSFDRLSEKVAETESLEDKLKQMEKRYSEKCAELSASNERNAQCLHELQQARSELKAERSQQEVERSKVAAQTSELQQLQIKVQKVIAERNNYRQKSDSIGKEMARICKNGRTLRDVEKILAEEASRRQELEVLREQKKKGSEELQKYQILYEQARRVQLMAGIDYDISRVLERNEELERLLSELTEYVSAKEMQLETLKQVNDALQAEIRDLAKASMRKNDV